MMSIEQIAKLPDDIQINVFQRWLKLSTLGQQTRQAICRLASERFDYDKLRDSWRRPLDKRRINHMNVLFSERPKTTHIRFRTPAGREVAMAVLKLCTKLDPENPTYVMKFVSTLDLGMDIALWTVHHYTGPRIFKEPHVQGYMYHEDSNTWR